MTEMQNTIQKAQVIAGKFFFFFKIEELRESHGILRDDWSINSRLLPSPFILAQIKD